MRVIIAGSRTIRNYYLVALAVRESGFAVTEVVSGGAPGVDRLGEEWARDCELPVKRFPADWKFYGRRAGPVRNGEMASYADALVAITTGSPGTADMIRQAEALGLLVYVKTVGGPAGGAR